MKHLFRLRMDEQKITLLAFSGGIIMFSMIMVWSYEAFTQDSDFLLQMFSGFEELMRAFVGVGFSLEELAASYLGMGWRHPLILFLFLSFGISRGVGLAGEIDRGTGDLLFSLPYSRRRIIATEFLTTVLSLFLLNLVLAASIYAFSRGFQLEDTPGTVDFLRALFLSFSLHIMFTALSFAVAASARTGGQAVGRAVGIVAVFYLMDFLASLQPQLEFLEPFTLFHQYRVTDALAGNAVWGELGLYTFLTLIFLLASFFFMQKRDL